MTGEVDTAYSPAIIHEEDGEKIEDVWEHSIRDDLVEGDVDKIEVVENEEKHDEIIVHGMAKTNKEGFSETMILPPTDSKKYKFSRMVEKEGGSMADYHSLKNITVELKRVQGEWRIYAPMTIRDYIGMTVNQVRNNTLLGQKHKTRLTRAFDSVYFSILIGLMFLTFPIGWITFHRNRIGKDSHDDIGLFGAWFAGTFLWGYIIFAIVNGLY